MTGQYQQVLGRTPDASGLGYWTGQLQAGQVSTTSLTVSLLASSEHFADAGATDSGWVNQLYANILGRTPSSSEVTFWSAVLQQHGRSFVARSIVSSTEATNVAVDDLYGQLLGRAPDPSGRTFTQHVIQQDGTYAAATRISSSPEYADHAQQRFG